MRPQVLTSRGPRSEGDRGQGVSLAEVWWHVDRDRWSGGKGQGLVKGQLQV